MTERERFPSGRRDSSKGRGLEVCGLWASAQSAKSGSSLSRPLLWAAVVRLVGELVLSTDPFAPVVFAPLAAAKDELLERRAMVCDSVMPVSIVSRHRRATLSRRKCPSLPARDVCQFYMYKSRGAGNVTFAALRLTILSAAAPHSSRARIFFTEPRAVSRGQGFSFTCVTLRFHIHKKNGQSSDTLYGAMMCQAVVAN